MDKFELGSQYRELTPNDIPSGLFSSPQIQIYLNHGLLVTGYIKEGVRSSTYDMRLGSPFFVFKARKRIITHLGEKTDRNAEVYDSVVIMPNQLVFVTTIESFKLPVNVIARFNLKAGWVHKGLLLGTGPIVDPQFTGRLLIPIHNFSSNIIVLKYGAPLIAVEFTKTLQNPKISSNFVSNDNKNGDPCKYFKNLEPTESSVYAKFRELESDLNKYQTLYETIRTVSIIGGITFVLLMFGIFYQVIQMVNSHMSFYSDTRTAIEERVNKLANEINILSEQKAYPEKEKGAQPGQDQSKK